MSFLVVRRAGAARQRSCRAITPGARLATRACATRPTRRVSMRSSQSCATPPTTVMAGGRASGAGMSPMVARRSLAGRRRQCALGSVPPLGREAAAARPIGCSPIGAAIRLVEPVQRWWPPRLEEESGKGLRRVKLSLRWVPPSRGLGFVRITRSRLERRTALAWNRATISPAARLPQPRPPALPGPRPGESGCCGC